MSILFEQQSAVFSIGGAYNNSGVFSGQYKSARPLGTAAAFAADVVSRIQNSDAAPVEGSGSDAQEAAYKNLGKAASRNRNNLENLQTSLENTINAIASRHGVQAATEVMNIVSRNAGSEVGEESLGQGFLKAISYIDRNFGIDQGNVLMGELNEGLNKEMNALFNNGSDEVFFDAGATTPQSAMRVVKAFMKQTEGMFDELLDSTGMDEPAVPETGTAENMQEVMLEAQAKRMLARGKIPPAYLQEYLPGNMIAGVAPGALIDTAV